MLTTDSTRLAVSRGQQTWYHSTYVTHSFLLCIVFKTLIFVFKKISWPWNGGQRSLKVIESGIIRSIVYGFLLVFFSNFVPKMHRFWDIWLQKCRDLEKRVRGHSRSLKMPPCHRTHMTSYWRSIVTMALSRVVSEIFNVEKCRDLEIGDRGHSRSLKVVPCDRACMISY